MPKIPKIDPFANATAEEKAVFLKHGIKNPTPLQWAGVHYFRAGAALGCPQQQMVNLQAAGIWLQEKQLEFAAAARACDFDGGPIYVGFGGPRGPGKSFALLSQCGADDCQRFPGLKVLYLRKVGRAAKEQFEDMRVKVFGRLKANYRQGKDMTFENGSRIIIGHFKDEKEIDNYLGQEYDEMVIEELTTLSKEKVENLLSCLRTSKEGWRPRLYASWNWGGVGHCVPFGEVLTEHRGWVDISKIKVGDFVYTVNHKGEMVPSMVEQIHASRFTGSLKTVRQRGFFMTCTPNHSVARVTGLSHTNKSGFVLTPFNELPGHVKILRSARWTGKDRKSFKVQEHIPAFPPGRKRKLDQPKEISGDQFMELTGWFLSEGFCMLGKGRDLFGISQSKPIQRERIKSLLSECGFHFRTTPTSFEVYSRDWAFYFFQFGKCREKFIHGTIKHASARQLRILFDAMMAGDGHWSDGSHNSGAYYTISDRLAGDFQEVALKLGFITLVAKRQRGN